MKVLCLTSSLILLFYSSLTQAINEDELIIELPDGKIHGINEKSFNGLDYYSYYRIPFAAPPLNEKRFKEPANPEPWEGILDATQISENCAQFSQSSADVIGTEDCLYLSIHTPAKPGNDSALPVLLWIHGGGFMTGSIEHYGPQFLMDYDIIVVIIQYRLGVFGFLSTNDGVVPANLGLKDQRKAINWVHSNIKYFGGDPNKITIMGESAGSMSVSALLTDLTLEGKFRGAIQQSGSYAQRLVNVIHTRDFAYQLGTLLDDSFTISNSSEDLLNVFMESSTENLITYGMVVYLGVSTANTHSTGLIGEIPFGLVVENIENEKEPLLVTPPLESFRTGTFIKVPTIISFNSEESLIYGLIADNVTKQIANIYDEHPYKMADERFALSPENATKFGQELLKIYTNSTFEEDYGAFVRYTTDSTYTNGIFEQARLSSKYAPIYVYELSYPGEILGTFIFPNYKRMSIPGAGAVSHAEELSYIWLCDKYLSTADAPESDHLTRRRLLKLITNFIKYQNGTPKDDEELNNIIWPKVSCYDIEYLNINTTLSIKSNPRNFKKVSQIYEKYVGLNFVW